MNLLARRTGQACLATAYLLSSLTTAVMSLLVLPLLCHPASRRVWSDWHGQRAARLCHRPAPAHPAAFRRYLCWLATHVAISIPLGLVVLLCLGNILLATVVIPLWWVFPTEDPPPLLLDLPVATWHSALMLGALQLIVLVAAAYAAFPAFARAHATAALALLAPGPVELLAKRVETLTHTRSEALEAHRTELSRIERDLHDSIQARLVAIAMHVARARRVLTTDLAAAATLMSEAHDVTEEAMTELRGVIRTMYPPILTDRGLTGALSAVAARCRVPVSLEVGDLERIPAAVEAVAYYAVTEALTNVSKHSHATAAAVRVLHASNRLSIVVSDDGTGGATERAGGGLAGIRHRAHAFDGRLVVTSPAGGPTEVEMELPCGW